MKERPDYSTYSTVLFMDSMVALEGKPLSGQPWAEIDPAGPILILIAPQVMREIDKRKRDGRLGKRAREFNRLIAGAAESGRPSRIIPGPPAVDIAFAACERIDWNTLDDLDPEEGDDRVVAQILYASGVSADRKVLFSYDNNPIAMASRHGIKTRKMPDDWLLEPEPGPNEKELMKLRGRVSELEANEPDLSVSLVFGVDAPVQIYRINPLPGDQQYEFTRRILRENPKIQQRRDGMFDLMHLPLDYGYDDRYAKYRDKTVPRHAEQLHRYLEAEYSQVPFTLTLRNDGHLQAENLVIALATSGGGLHSRFQCYPIYGPVAPKPRNDYLMPHLSRMAFPQVPEQVGRHEMDFAVGPDGGPSIEVHCVDFRQGREWRFEGIARIDPYRDSPFRIKTRVTASNQRGAIEKRFELPFESRTAEVAELIRLDSTEFLVDFPMRAQVKEAFASDNRDWLEFPHSGNDEEDEDD